MNKALTTTILTLIIAISFVSGTNWTQYDTIWDDYSTYSGEQQNEYLTQTRPFQTNALMKRWCKSLKDDDVSKTIEQTLNFVSNTIDYDTSNKWHNDAKTTFTHMAGVCEDHANVLIALLRCQGIPSRKVEGQIIPLLYYMRYPYNEIWTTKHAWVEVAMPVLESYIVWYPIDTQNLYGTIKKTKVIQK